VTAALAAAIISVFLPPPTSWWGITAAHGRIVVTGSGERWPHCARLSVDPQSLHSSLAKYDCRQPGPDHLRFVLVRHSQWYPVYVGRRLAFRYNDASDTRPVSARYGDSLWVYDVATQRGAIVQRWSLATGTLQQEVKFPIRLWRPVLAANADGAWLMAATNGGEDGTDHVALWHVTSRGVSTVRRGPRAALWMTTHGRTLWLETVSGTSTFKLWRYDGTRGRLLWTKRDSYLVNGTSYGDGALWGISEQYCGKRLRAVRIDGRSGAVRTIVSVPLLACDNNQTGTGVYYRGSFWFINGNKLMRVH
jgi:hypothetical protein